MRPDWDISPDPIYYKVTDFGISSKREDRMKSQWENIQAETTDNEAAGAFTSEM